MKLRPIFIITFVIAVLLAGAWVIVPKLISAPPRHTSAVPIMHSELGENTLPPFEPQKIQKLINTTLKPEGLFIDPETGEEMGEYWFEALSTANYEALSLSEKFTYNAIHGESFHQNCSPYEMPDAAKNKKIGIDFSFEFRDKSQSFWSERQIRFFHENRSDVLTLLKKTMQADAHVGENLKGIILEIEAYELIPILIEKLEIQPKDYNLLTLMIALMDKDGYIPLHQTDVYKASLMQKKTTYYTSLIPATKAYEEEVIKTARHYYLEKKK